MYWGGNVSKVLEVERKPATQLRSLPFRYLQRLAGCSSYVGERELKEKVERCSVCFRSFAWPRRYIKLWLPWIYTRPPLPCLSWMDEEPSLVVVGGTSSLPKWSPFFHFSLWPSAFSFLLREMNLNANWKVRSYWQFYKHVLTSGLQELHESTVARCLIRSIYICHVWSCFFW